MTATEKARKERKLAELKRDYSQMLRRATDRLHKSDGDLQAFRREERQRARILSQIRDIEAALNPINR